jgi:hypothetical protein
MRRLTHKVRRQSLTWLRTHGIDGGPGRLRRPRTFVELVQVVPPDFDASLFEELKRRVVERVVYIEDHLNDATVDDHLGTHQARSEGGVENAILDAGAVVGRLSDGVLFGVGAQALVQPSAAAGQAVAAGTASLVAVLGSTRRSIVARGNNSSVSDYHGSNFALDAVRTHGSDLRDLHEVFVPPRPFLLPHRHQNPLVQGLPGVRF